LTASLLSEHELGSADEAAWLAAHEEAYMFGDPAERSEAFRRYLDENRLKPIRWLLESILAEFGIDAGSDDVDAAENVGITDVVEDPDADTCDPQGAGDGARAA
jgi:hypothetical protein